jgi:hypothetical protein
MRMSLKVSSNWAKIDWLKFSAVIPVPSDTINTMRVMLDMVFWGKKKGQVLQ